MNQRLVFIDYAKVLCTLFVVYAHVTPYDNPLRLGIASFLMPFFLFVSGILYKPTSVSKEISKTLKYIIVPAFIYILIAYIVRCIEGEDPVPLLKNSVIGFIKGEIIQANVVCWFLFALANIRLLASIWFRRKLVAITLLILGLLSFWKNFFYIAQSVSAFPFFILGYYCNDFLKEQSQKKFTYKSVLIPFLLLVGTSVLTYFNGRVSMVLLIWGDLPHGLNILVYYINAIIGTFGIIYFTFLLKWSNRYIEISANSLISCVGLQCIFYDGYLQLFGYHSTIISIFVSIIITIFCILLHQPLKKILPQFFK